jgi:hypothetical protein
MNIIKTVAAIATTTIIIIIIILYLARNMLPNRTSKPPIPLTVLIVSIIFSAASTMF